VIAADTSVVVAAFSSWHEGHAAASRALQRKPRLPAHVLLESYSVLTRLPAPHRAPADLVATFLAERFPEALLTLPEAPLRSLIDTAAAGGLIGGTVYDAVIAATAKHSGAVLLTRDRRAIATYERIAVRYEVVS
jgi:predicted nucleic acid-binding protein